MPHPSSPAKPRNGDYTAVIPRQDFPRFSGTGGLVRGFRAPWEAQTSTDKPWCCADSPSPCCCGSQKSLRKMPLGLLGGQAAAPALVVAFPPRHSPDY